MWLTNNSRNNIQRCPKKTIPKRFVIDIALIVVLFCLIMHTTDAEQFPQNRIYPLHILRELMDIVISLFKNEEQEKFISCFSHFCFVFKTIPSKFSQTKWKLIAGKQYPNDYVCVWETEILLTVSLNVSHRAIIVYVLMV